MGYWNRKERKEQWVLFDRCKVLIVDMFPLSCISILFCFVVKLLFLLVLVTSLSVENSV